MCFLYPEVSPQSSPLISLIMIELSQSYAVGVAELIPFPIRVGAPIKACLSEWSLIIFEVYGLQPNTSP